MVVEELRDEMQLVLPMSIRYMHWIFVRVVSLVYLCMNFSRER